MFVDATHGFALVNGDQAQYPAATTDGGLTWRTDGPALHVDAAQGPLAVTEIGALNRRTIFAYGGGGNVVDVTTDGGRHWRRALWGDGTPMAVVSNFKGQLVAFVDLFGSGSSANGPTWQYVSRDGGRTLALHDDGRRLVSRPIGLAVTQTAHRPRSSRGRKSRPTPQISPRSMR